MQHRDNRGIIHACVRACVQAAEITLRIFREGYIVASRSYLGFTRIYPRRTRDGQWSCQIYKFVQRTNEVLLRHR